ncbi:MAG: GGDEF domain-containing protein [Aquificae bacterium]|nr:GGDEF domain-containing protein [Aquificota bacterium]
MKGEEEFSLEKSTLKEGGYVTYALLLEKLNKRFNEPEGFPNKEIINDVAKELLKKEAQKDRYIVEQLFVKELREGGTPINDALLMHMHWLMSFLKDVVELKGEPSLGEGQRRCEFKRFLTGVKPVSRNKKLIREINAQQKTVHITAGLVYENLSRKDYLNAFLHYTNCIKASYRLISLLSMLNVKHITRELKKDPLTGLLNRRILNRVFRDILELSLYTEVPFSVAIVDIDDFKSLNDRYGHLVGDCVLKHLARILRRSFRRSDYVFRYGGEEFLIIMPSTPLGDALKILENLRRRIEETTIRCGDVSVKITVSIGVCSDIYTGSKTPEDYIYCADMKLYEAKRKGKNKVVA